MTDLLARLQAALADRYRLEHELGQGGMTRRLVAQATARPLSLKRPDATLLRHVSDISRAAASAATQSARATIRTIPHG